MRTAGRHLVGIHDFKSFQGQGSSVDDTVRHITDLSVCQDVRRTVRWKNDRITIEVRGNGFLRFMVRNIVGTLVDVGLGKIPPDDVGEILKSRDRSQAGATAPPQGLFLVRVNY